MGCETNCFMAGPHCLIFERDVGGHRLHHVHHLVDALADIGCEVIVASRTDARASPEWAVHLKPIESRFRFVPGPIHLPNNLRNGWRTGSDLLNTIRELRPDRVYIPCTEYFTQAAALRCLVTGRRRFPGPPIEGHLNRGTYAYPSESLRDAVRSAISWRLALRSPWQITHLLDPWVWDELKGHGMPSDFRVIPEPVEPLPAISRDDALRTLGAPTDGRYLALVGGLTPNKGAEPLLLAFSQLKLAAEDRILLVGKMSKPIRELIDRDYAQLVKDRRLVTIDRYVSDFELGCGFIASDIVGVVHERLIGSSGALVRAAHAGRQLLTTSYGWAGWATKRFDLGRTVDVSDFEALKSTIADCFQNTTPYRRSEKGARFCKFHTLANWKAHWVAGIGRDGKIPLGTLADRVTWEWTMEGVDPARDVWKTD
jgi:glycosyltransferase involved in cell wall biosynthesis